MQLYADPISTTSRPILLFLAEHPAAVDFVTVSLMEGGHQKPEYAVLNPNKCVPTLADGDFVLTESSAILKYLADRTGSAAYPGELHARARVNQLMDWFNTGFYRDFGYGVVYPQTLPNYRNENPVTQADVIKAGEERARRWLAVLNDNWLAEGPFLTGSEVTIADYLGASYVTIADWIGYDLSDYPKVTAWIEAMRARPSWGETHAAFDGLVAYMRSQQLQPA